MIVNQCHLLKHERFLGGTWDGDISSENTLPLDSSLAVLNSLKNISSLSAEALGQFSTETSPSQVKIYISSLSK